MNDDRRDRLEYQNRLAAAFAQVVELPSDQQGARIIEICAGDEELRRDLESLLPYDDPSIPGPQPSQVRAPKESWVGREIGKYKIIDLISNAGGQGEVYRAEQTPPIQRTVALKTIQPWGLTEKARRDFKTETQAQSILDHPNIARVHDAGEHDGRPYYVMEYVEIARDLTRFGDTAKHITRYCDLRSLSIPDRLDLFQQVCDALEYAHQNGFIHRDVKPGNVLVSERDGTPFVKVIDFGIAKAIGARATGGTRTGEPQPHTLAWASPEQLKPAQVKVEPHTPGWASPEQVTAESHAPESASPEQLKPAQVTAQTDVYSLGLLLYKLLTGVLPHDDMDMAQQDRQLRQRVEERLPPSRRLRSLGNELAETARRRSTDPARLQRRVAGELDWITMKAVEMEPGRRYATVAHLREDVERYLSGQAVSAGPPRFGYRAGKYLRRHWWQTVTAGLAGVLVLSAIALVTTTLSYQRGLALLADLQQHSLDGMTNSAVAFAIDQGDSTFVQGLLAASPPGDDPQWERRHLAWLADSSVRALDVPAADSVAISPDGEFVAVACHDGAIRIFHPGSATPEELSGGLSMYDTVAWHPARDVLAAAGTIAPPDVPNVPRAIELFDLEPLRSGHEARRLAQEPADHAAGGLLFHPSRDLLIGREKHGEGVVVVFRQCPGGGSPDGQLPVVARLSMPPHEVTVIDLSPDGRWLATGHGWSVSPGHVPVMLWDVAKVLADAAANEGVAAGVEPVRLLGHTYHVTDVQFSPDGQALASGSADGTVRVWSIAAQREMGVANHGGPITTIAFPSADRIVIGIEHGALHEWRTRPLGALAISKAGVLLGHANEIRSLACSRDGRTCVSGARDSTVRLWVSGTDPVPRLLYHGTSVVGASFSDDGRYVYSIDGSGLIIASEADRAIPAGILESGPIAFNSFASAPGGIIAAATERPEQGILILRMSDPAQPRVEATITTSLSEGVAHRALALSNDGSHLALGDAAGVVRVYDLRPSQPILVREFTSHETGVGALLFLDDGGATLACGNTPSNFEASEAPSSSSLTIWNVTTSELIHEIASLHEQAGTDQAHEAGITKLALTPSCDLLASGANDGSVCLWTLRPGSPGSIRCTSRLAAHVSPVLALAFHPSEHRLASGSMDGTLILWDTGRGIRAGSFRGHTGAIRYAAFSPDGQRLALSSGGREGSGNVVYLREALDLEGAAKAAFLRRRAVARDAFRDVYFRFIQGRTEQKIREWAAESMIDDGRRDVLEEAIAVLGRHPQAR